MPIRSLCHFRAKKSASVQRGFTLVEMLITVAILAILLGIAVPSFNSVTLGMKLSSYANSIVSSTNMARSEAIKRNAVVSLCVSTDGSTCSSTGRWEQGWIVACKTTDHALCNAAGTDWLVLHRQSALSAGFKVTETSDTPLAVIDFMPTGLGATQASMTICRAGANSEQQRQVAISATGRAFVTKTTSTACS